MLTFEENSLNNCVSMRGRLNREGISECFSRADCFVLPSESETFGVAFIEAMSAGLPVIATKCGGPEDYVSESNGYLIENGDGEQLLDAMERAYRREDRFDSERIREYAEKSFSPSGIAEKLTAYYQGILRNHK